MKRPINAKLAEKHAAESRRAKSQHMYDAWIQTDDGKRYLEITREFSAKWKAELAALGLSK